MLSENIQKFILEFQNTCKASNKAAGEIEIVAASKTRNIETILELKKGGIITAFGENKVQELLSKYDSSITWDIIGQLQTNKVKYIIDKVRLIQSVDRINLLEEINYRAAKINKIQKILIEINTGAEDSKGGVLLEDVNNLCKQTLNYKNIELNGLMAVAPLEIEEVKLKGLFLDCKRVYDELSRSYESFKYLSMGMSNDYKLAIECGSNMIRPGRILFN